MALTQGIDLFRTLPLNGHQTNFNSVGGRNKSLTKKHMFRIPCFSDGMSFIPLGEKGWEGIREGPVGAVVLIEVLPSKFPPTKEDGRKDLDTNKNAPHDKKWIIY